MRTGDIYIYGLHTDRASERIGSLFIQPYALNNVGIYENAYWNGSGFVYDLNGYATRINQNVGQITLSTAASGTAGNAPSWVQALTVAQGGLVGIGVGSETPLAVLDLGSTVSSKKLFLYSTISNNAKYGFGIASGELEMYCTDEGSSHISFGTLAMSDGATFVEKMRMTSSGYLGIGCVPTHNFDIQTETGGDGGAYIQTQTANTRPGIFLSWTGASPGECARFSADMATGEVKIGGTAAAFFDTFYAGGLERVKLTTDGNAAATCLIGKLSTTTGINGKTETSTTLYTVPAAKSAVITKVVVRCTAATAANGDAQYSLGSNSTSYDNWGGTFTTASPSAANTCAIPIPEDGSPGSPILPVLQAADNFKINITSGETGTAVTYAVDVFGYLL